MRLIPLFLLATVSCSVGSAVESVSVASPQSCLTGKVFSVGTDFAPATILRLNDGQETHITGDGAARTRLLTGALVTVCGPITTGATVIEVESLELRAVDGMTAYLGMLEEAGDAWKLKRDGSGAPIPLSGVPEQLREAEGSLVWVAGNWGDQTFLVKSFGLVEG